MYQAVILIIVCILTAVDQLLKSLIVSKLKPIGSMDFIPGIRFRYIENSGAAFGIFQQKTIILAVLTLVVIIIGFYIIFSRKLTDKAQVTGAVLILSGGIGNLIDRIFVGYVVDYIEFTFINFAVFNFADCLITVGAVILIISLLVEFIKESKNKKLIETQGHSNG